MIESGRSEPLGAARERTEGQAVVGSLLAWFIGLVVFFGIVFFLFWLIVTAARVLGPERSRRAAALALLRERLARGEISTTEFEEARRILGA